MAAKRTAAKAGFNFFRAAPAKGKLAKGAFRLGRRRAIRTPAGTAVLYGQALVGNQQARKDLRGAYTSARKAYARTADWRGRPDIGALFEDRKARKETGKALSSLREALKVAGRTRTKPKSRKGPVIAVVAVAGAGTALALNENLRATALAPFTGTDSGDGGAASDAGGASYTDGAQARSAV